MKRTAEQWAELLAMYSFPNIEICAPDADSTDLALLLRAMVAEREALEDVAYCPSNSMDPVLAATAARRRAEGEE
jgi:hypothetical protein